MALPQYDFGSEESDHYQPGDELDDEFSGELSESSKALLQTITEESDVLVDQAGPTPKFIGIQ